MRFVMFFGILAGVAGLWMLTQIIPPMAVFYGYLVAVSVGVVLAFLWRLCCSYFPPKGDRS